MTKTYLPAGTYYIGDLCYVIKDDEWLNFLTETDYGNKEFYQGQKFAMRDTKYGDGLYNSSIGVKFPVDSGMIGCIQVDQLENIELKTEGGIQLGAIVEMDVDFDVEAAEDGTLYFSHVAIDTGCIYDEEFE